MIFAVRTWLFCWVPWLLSLCYLVVLCMYTVLNVLLFFQWPRSLAS